MPHDHVQKIKFLTPAPPSPKPWGMHDPEDRMKIESNMCYIFHLWEDTNISLKLFEIDFVIEIYDIWPLGPSPRPQEAGTLKYCAVACAIHVSNSHTKSGWI